jgi:hypothetical protein
MSILLYLEESELSLIFKSLRYLGTFDKSEKLDDLSLRLRLLHGDLDEEDFNEESENNSNV